MLKKICENIILFNLLLLPPQCNRMGEVSRKWPNMSLEVISEWYMLLLYTLVSFTSTSTNSTRGTTLPIILKIFFFFYCRWKFVLLWFILEVDVVFLWILLNLHEENGLENTKKSMLHSFFFLRNECLCYVSLCAFNAVKMSLFYQVIFSVERMNEKHCPMLTQDPPKMNIS